MLRANLSPRIVLLIPKIPGVVGDPRIEHAWIDVIINDSSVELAIEILWIGRKRKNRRLWKEKTDLMLLYCPTPGFALAS